MSSDESYMEVMKWAHQLRWEMPLADAIDVLSVRIQETNGEEHRILARQLASFLSEAGRYAEALQILDEMIERNLDDVNPALAKATLYLYSLEDPEEALRWIDLAVQRAYRTQVFRRHALANKARILLELRRGEQLSQVLEEIMSLRMIKGVPDVARERDFVDRAPRGLIREDVVARYNEFRPKRAGDTTANEPPEFEPPDDYE